MHLISERVDAQTSLAQEGMSRSVAHRMDIAAASIALPTLRSIRTLVRPCATTWIVSTPPSPSVAETWVSVAYSLVQVVLFTSPMRTPFVAPTGLAKTTIYTNVVRRRRNVMRQYVPVARRGYMELNSWHAQA
jgi:hypothetical protein